MTPKKFYLQMEKDQLPICNQNSGAIVLRGWIKPTASAFVRASNYDVTPLRDELTALGVEVGIWNVFQSEFQECKVSMAALERLDSLWGKYIWGLA